MNSISIRERSVVADGLYNLLNPIPFGCFVAALVFDVVYARSGDVMWEKSAAWLLALGLVVAIIPRLINLVRVGITRRFYTSKAGKIDFWLNLFAVVLAIVNSFVHSRDAYGSVPEGMWLSAGTVALLCVAHVLLAVQPTPYESQRHA